MSDKKYKIPSRMKVPHPVEDEANVEQLLLYKHSLEMEWDESNLYPFAEDIPEKDDSTVAKKSLTLKGKTWRKKSSDDSIATKSSAKNKVKSIKKPKSANKKPILSSIVNSISNFFSQKYTALSQKILGFVLKCMPNDFWVKPKKFYDQVTAQVRLTYMTFKTICKVVGSVAKKFYSLVTMLAGWIYMVFKAICNMVWILAKKFYSLVTMLAGWIYMVFKAICNMVWTLAKKFYSLVTMLAGWTCIVFKAICLMVCDLAKKFYGHVTAQVRWAYMKFQAICARVANLAKKYGYITKVYVMHMMHVYITAKNSLSRKSGTALLLIGLALVLFQKLSANIPIAMLPLTHVSSAGTLDSVGSSPLPIKSDSTFENNIFTTSYRIEKRVEKGNTLGNVLNRANIANDKKRSVMFRSMRQIFNPRNVFVGQKIILDVVGGYSSHMPVHVQSMEIIIDAEKSIVVSWDSSENEYITKMVSHPLNIIFKSAEGEIESSLYLAMEKQGVKREAVVDFINLFSFDVDFQRDIRKGDKFDIGYKEFVSTDGVYVRNGDIYVAELYLQGSRRRYYQFTAKNGRTGYYDWLGRSGRKSLMKTPIEGARLSSGFGNRRHPILGYTKFHNGTDFAAPRGTPIFAAGDGVVEYAGRKGVNGIYVRIRHNGVYKTAYAHMSGIAKGVSAGKVVKQGKVIGYVGTTGRSTGNHLHYSVFNNGRPIDSRRMKLPSGASLKGDDLVAFKKLIKPLMKNGK